RRHKVGAGSDPSQKEVEDNPPAPVRVGNEGVHARPPSWGIGSGEWGVGPGSPLFPIPDSLLPLSRNANSIPSIVKKAAATLQREPLGTLELGSFGLDGNPYVSGLSSSK